MNEEKSSVCATNKRKRGEKSQRIVGAMLYDQICKCMKKKMKIVVVGADH